MSNEVVISLLSFAGTLLGSLFGILAAQKLTQYRLEQLEAKVNKHNNLIERTFKLEGRVDNLETEVHDLKKYHAPN